jgi:hypothetical protein
MVFGQPAATPEQRRMAADHPPPSDDAELQAPSRFGTVASGKKRAVNNTQEPMPVNDPYDRGRTYRPDRDGTGANRAALIIHTVADIAAAFLALWIVLYLLDANHANVFVGFVHDVADFLAGWSQDIFTMETEGLRVLLNYGLPAVIYLLIGHGLAARLRRV